MTIPKSSETKQPILKYLSKARESTKIATITDLMGAHFRLSKKEMAEEMPKGGKRFAVRVGVALNEMKSAGFVKSPRHGHVVITAKGRKGLQSGSITDGRRKADSPRKTQTIKQLPVTLAKRDDKMVQRTTDIVGSYVGKNSVSAKQLPGLIKSIYGTLEGLGTSQKTVAKRKYTRRKKVTKKSAS